MKSKKIPYLLLLPQIALSVIFVAGILSGLVQSFGIMPSLGLKEPTLQYYRDLLTREDLLSSLFFSIHFSLTSSLIAVVLGVFFCALLVQLKQTKGIVMRIVQLPIVVPHVVVAFFVIHFLSQNGLIARLMYHFGWIDAQSAFPLLVFDRGGIGVIIGYLWKETPFIVYFVIALMASIDESLGEAAINLGASRIRTFFRVTLPLCLPTIVGGFLIIFTYSLGAYELPYILGATEPKALPIWAYIQYTHPDLLNRPYAMAVNGIIIVISILAVGSYWLVNRRFHEKV